MAKLNELGKLLENRIKDRRKRIEQCKKENSFAYCIMFDGQVIALEGMWLELMNRGLLTE